MTSVAEILSGIGPALSSQVTAVLRANGTTHENARKIVSRARSPVMRLKQLNFKNRESFLYLDDQYGTEAFYVNLESAIWESHSAYSKILAGLVARGGQVLEKRLPIASGLPIQLAKGHITGEQATAALLDVSLIRRIQSDQGPVIRLANSSTQSTRRLAAEAVEEFVLSALGEWLMRLNLTSRNMVRTRESDLPQYRQFAFDLTCPTFVQALATRKISSVDPGFLCGDIILDRELSVADLTPFIAKTHAIRSQKGVKGVQPFFVADNYAPDALEMMRGEGILLLGPSAAFGPEVARAIRELIQAMENIAARLQSDPEALFKIFEQLYKLEGVSGNLRGLYLELLVAHVHLVREFRADVRRQINVEGRQAEIDVKATSTTDVVCIECKAKARGNLVTRADISEWEHNSLPIIKEWLKLSSSLSGHKKRFEFYTTTDYDEEAQELIKELEQRHVRMPITFLTGSDLVQRLRDLGLSSLIPAFREQFM